MRIYTMRIHKKVLVVIAIAVTVNQNALRGGISSILVKNTTVRVSEVRCPVEKALLP
jgi:hypothetical protein